MCYLMLCCLIADSRSCRAHARLVKYLTRLENASGTSDVKLSTSILQGTISPYLSLTPLDVSYVMALERLVRVIQNNIIMSMALVVMRAKLFVVVLVSIFLTIVSCTLARWGCLY